MTFFTEFVLRAMSRRDEEGQGLAEYGLILALVAILTVGALGALQGGLDAILNQVAGALGG